MVNSPLLVAGGLEVVLRPDKRQVLTPRMIRAARALSDLEQARLAALVGVTRKTIALIERTVQADNIDPRRRVVLEKIRRLLEQDFNIEFTFASGTTGEGVRMKLPGKNT